MTKKEMDIPIIIVHRGYSRYVEPALEQARLYNKDADIYLLGDKHNADIYNHIIEHHSIDEYGKSAQEFRKVYKHMSSNTYDFELFCFERWFIINEFAAKHNIKNFLCLDSDVLLYCNVNKSFSQYLDYDFTICLRKSPHTSLFNIDSLKTFCKFIMHMYTDDVYLERLEHRYQSEFVAKGQLGGNCDMTAFTYIQEYAQAKVKDLTIEENNRRFDDIISRVIDFVPTKKGLKKTYWINNLPHCKRLDTGEMVQFLSLHFQGSSKFYIFHHLVGSNLKRSMVNKLKTNCSMRYFKAWFFHKKLNIPLGKIRNFIKL